jgi:hypothetical protein
VSAETPDPVRPPLRSLRDQLAEVMYDQAHDNCDADGCTGGGHPYYAELATHFLMPVIAEWLDAHPEVSR